MAITTQYMIASYRVKPADQNKFLNELQSTETAYQKAGLLSDKSIIRMTSRVDPEFIIEIIEWIDSQAFAAAQENSDILGHWGRLEEIWLDGGFGFDHVPESKNPWATFNPLAE